MAVDIDGIKACLEIQDYEAFLRLYLLGHQSDPSLTVPVQVNLVDIKEEWLEIIIHYQKSVTDEFVETLSTLWIKISTDISGENTQDLVEQMIKNLKGNTKESRKAGQRIRSSMHPDIKVGISATISKEYHRLKEFYETTLNPKESMDKLLRKAYRNNDLDGFIAVFLVFLRENLGLSYPKTSILNEVENDWIDIFKNDYRYRFDRSFVLRLSFRWFFFVNDVRLPIEIASIDAILKQLVLHSKFDIQTYFRSETPSDTQTT